MRKMGKRKRRYWIQGTTVLLAGILFMMPVFLIVMNAFKPNTEIMLSFLSPPKSLYLHNFQEAMRLMNFWVSFRNTAVIAVGTVILSVTVSYMAAYGISHLKGKLSDCFYLFFVLGQLVSIHTVMVYISVLATKLHMNNTLWGMILIHGGFNSAFGVMTYTGFLKSVPRELEEAAAIDGCGAFQIMTHIVLPLVKPTTMTMSVLYFLWSWNEFLLPSILIGNSDLRPLTVNLNMFKSASGTEWNYLIAGLTLTLIPIFVIYILAQKYITNGMMAGAVKS